MVRASNKTIAGKSGLAGAAVALSLSGAHLIFSPLTVLPTAAAFAVMSKALRHPKVLKALMASRNPNTLKQFMSGKFRTDDPIAQAFQVMNQLIAQATLQGGYGLGEQSQQELRPVENLAAQRVGAQMGSAEKGVEEMQSVLGKIGQGAVNTVTRPFTGQSPATPPAQARPQISPILVPNPSTRATFGQ